MVRRSFKGYAATLFCLGFAAGQLVCLADEVSTSSTSVTPTITGADVSTTKSSVKGNCDGSVTSARERETQSLDAAGGAAVREKSATSTTVNPDGTSSTIRKESTSTSP